MVVDFPDGGANPRVRPYANLLYGTIFTENCIQMKEKKYGSRGGACVSRPLDRPLILQSLTFGIPIF